MRGRPIRRRRPAPQGTAAADETLRKDEAYAAVIAGGERHEVHIAHASGTAANPMSDAAIEAKFLANATPVIGRERAERRATSCSRSRRRRSDRAS